MNPFLVSLAVVASLMITMTAWIILPSFNLHMINSSTAILKDKVQAVLDSTRTSPDLALSEIEALDLPNVMIDKIEVKDVNDFLNYQISFHFTNLFANKFFTREEYEGKQASLGFLIDKV